MVHSNCVGRKDLFFGIAPEDVNSFYLGWLKQHIPSQCWNSHASKAAGRPGSHIHSFPGMSPGRLDHSLGYPGWRPTSTSTSPSQNPGSFGRAMEFIQLCMDIQSLQYNPFMMLRCLAQYLSDLEFIETWHKAKASRQRWGMARVTTTAAPCNP